MDITEAPTLKIEEYSPEILRTFLHRRPESLYAVLDACDEPRVPAMVHQLGPERAVSLYRGWAERDYWAIAPYLSLVDEPLLNWIFDNLWKDPWGIFMTSGSPLDAIRRHLRRFLTVEDVDGDRMYFRFYDPRVLPTFLETSTHHENVDFFGPVTAFFVQPNVDQVPSLEPGSPSIVQFSIS